MSNIAEFTTVEKPKIKLTPDIEKIYSRVDARIAKHDHMAANNLNHYFGVGASALRINEICLSLAGIDEPKSILDFACGAGRVTRWFRAAYPTATLVACDVRDADLNYQSEILGTEAWKSSASFQLLKPPMKFDLIWVGSLLSHLSEADTNAAMTAFMSWLNPNGILVTSFHGRRVHLGKTMRGAKYISDQKFAVIEQDYLKNGFGYADYDNQKGLGFTITDPSWFFNFVKPHTEWKILGTFEASWDDHHDVCAIQNTPVCIPK